MTKRVGNASYSKLRASPSVRGESSEAHQLLLLNYRVFLRKFLLLAREVVELALVGFGVSVLRAVDESALAGHLDQAGLLVAAPALVKIILNTCKNLVEQLGSGW